MWKKILLVGLIKQHKNMDTSWGIQIIAHLNKEDAKQYRKEFKEFHQNKLKEDEETLKEF